MRQVQCRCWSHCAQFSSRRRTCFCLCSYRKTKNHGYLQLSSQLLHTLWRPNLTQLERWAVVGGPQTQIASLFRTLWNSGLCSWPRLTSKLALWPQRNPCLQIVSIFGRKCPSRGCSGSIFPQLSHTFANLFAPLAVRWARLPRVTRLGAGPPRVSPRPVLQGLTLGTQCNRLYFLRPRRRRCYQDQTRQSTASVRCNIVAGSTLDPLHGTPCTCEYRVARCKHICRTHPGTPIAVCLHSTQR
mmetsp:Transcript_25385/g.49933  ORF Transcript_25385/g.49933 Transcript_25385/m.49933 type:complete len:243 (-) Transcript_25385:1493-2221(-)